MNPKLQFIFQRRSVRRYRSGEIPEAMVRDMLEAAMSAPSAAAKDPWQFIVVRDRARLKDISGGLPYGKMLAEAGLGVVVCGRQKDAHKEELSYLLQDCSAAVENLLLAASALGLGAVWLGIHPRQDRMDLIRRLLGVPEDVTPVAVISIGWPAESPEPRTRYEAAKVHQERW